MQVLSLLVASTKVFLLEPMEWAGKQSQASSSSSPLVSNRDVSPKPTSHWRFLTRNKPVVIIIFTFFIPSSPRWLLSKDRDEDAKHALRRLRPKANAENGDCDAEIQAIKEALQEHVHKGPWLDLVRGNNLRRTVIVFVYYFFQQVSDPLHLSISIKWVS